MLESDDEWSDDDEGENEDVLSEEDDEEMEVEDVKQKKGKKVEKEEEEEEEDSEEEDEDDFEDELEETNVLCSLTAGKVKDHYLLVALYLALNVSRPNKHLSTSLSSVARLSCLRPPVTSTYLTLLCITTVNGSGSVVHLMGNYIQQDEDSDDGSDSDFDGEDDYSELYGSDDDLEPDSEEEAAVA